MTDKNMKILKRILIPFFMAVAIAIIIKSDIGNISSRLVAIVSRTPIVSVSVVRTINGNEVTLKIVSNQKMLAIKENLPQGVNIVGYSLGGGYKTVGYKESEKTWVIADPLKTINATLVYGTTASPVGVSGVYYYFNGLQTITGNIK